MNRANQAALFQQTNQGLLNIRQLELNYYINLNIAFGTQAALIGGFSFALLTQAGFDTDVPLYKYVMLEVTWVTCACTVAAAVHVIITTMLMQVLGPGLALHGPIGSMARASQGMRLEQKSVVVAFGIMIVTFALSTVLSFFNVMSITASIASTVIFLIALRYWWFYSERIYLRFYWETDEAMDRFGAMRAEDEYDEIDPAEPQLPDYLRHTVVNNNLNGTFTHQERITSRDSTASKRKAKIRQKSFIGRMFSRTKSSAETKNAQYGLPGGSQHESLTESLLRDHHAAKALEEQEPTHHSHVSHPHAPPIVTSAASISMEGYLLKKVSSHGAMSASSSHHHHLNLLSLDFHAHKEFERRYFVLHVNGHMFYYTTRQDFRDNPRKPIHKRPVNLADFIVESWTNQGMNPVATGGGGNGRRGGDHQSVVSMLWTGGASDRHSRTNSTTNFDDDVSGTYGTGGGSILGSHNRRPSSSLLSTMTGHESSSNGNSSSSGKMIFQLVLTPKDGIEIAPDTVSTLVDEVSSSDRQGTHEVVVRQPWVLRADTEEELEMWLVAMREVSPTSFF